MQQIVFFGDSLTAGYRLANPDTQSLPALIQQKIKDANLNYHVVNAGISGDTSASGLDRITGLLNQQIDIFVLALGANDILRNISPTATSRNLQSIITLVKEKFPNVKLLLLGMELPVWVPGIRVSEFRKIFRNLATTNKMAFLPFLLEGVAGIKNYNLPDGVHPIASGYEIIANNVWPVLLPLL